MGGSCVVEEERELLAPSHPKDYNYFSIFAIVTFFKMGS
jgi:hypothetical protein